ncbi:MFS transporter [Kitasatospora azatica]|uniref:MFS transporter n=1 Tax=Kitasatospora azatica TaxID=58347 RepID=UPI0012FB242C|nr:MFS transporter [Kitasatospora azatica]
MTQAVGGGAAGAQGSAAPPPAKTENRSGGLRRATIVVLAAGCGLSVANLYYIQPLVPVMAADLHIAPAALAPAVSSTQIGYAAGLFGLVPLGDVLDRRKLLTCLMSAAAVVLALLPLASSALLPLFYGLLGLVSVSAMVIVPQAAELAPQRQRGRVVGTVMTGLILGALLCRTFAGALAGLAGWRSVYWVAAVLTIGMTVAVRRVVPTRGAGSGAQGSGLTLRGYARLFTSLGPLVRARPVIIERSLYGALGFGTFNVFWTALPLRLSAAPYHYGAPAIGLLGLLGVAGAIGASFAGRLADRGLSRTVTAAAFALIVLTFTGAHSLSGELAVLVSAILVLDFAAQGAHITNQTVVFAGAADSRSRVTTIYMTSYFLGGAAGSTAAGFAWTHGGWPSVCVVGIAMAAAALLVLLAGELIRRRR